MAARCRVESHLTAGHTNAVAGFRDAKWSDGRVLSSDCPPPCPPPATELRPPRRIVLPPGAVDAHSHVIGPCVTYPYVKERSYTPPEASPAAFIEMLDRTGLSYGVLTQVSVHGNDNGPMIEALARYPQRLRGIASVPLGLPARAYEQLKRAGFVGLRLNMFAGGVVTPRDLAAYDALASDLGWQLQFLIAPSEVQAVSSTLASLKSPVVIDHMGFLPTTEPITSPAFQAVVALVRSGAWVKLSGAFRLSVQGPPYADTIPFARALLEAAPERCMWGSDWPHVAHVGKMMTVADLLELLADWAPEAALQKQVLVDNPRELFGFP